MEALLQLLQQLIIGRDSKWKLLPESEWYQAAWDAAADTSQGVYLENSPKTLLEVQMRETREYRTVYVEINSLDDSANHTVTLDGSNNFSYQATSGDTINDVLTGLRDDINNNSTQWDASVEGGGTRLKIIGDGFGQADYSLQASSSGSTSFITDGDCVDGQFRVHTLAKEGSGNDERDWCFAEDGFYRNVDWRGRTQRLDTASLERADVEFEIIDNITGEPGSPHRIRFGPAVEEV